MLISAFGLLPEQALSEAGSFMLWAGAVMLVRRAAAFLRDGLKAALGCLLFAGQFYILARDNIRSELFLSVMLALLLSLSLYFSGIIMAAWYDIPYLAAAFLFSRRLFNSSFALFGYGIEYLLILYVLLMYGWLVKKRAQGGLIRTYTAFLMSSIELFLYDAGADLCTILFRNTGSNAVMLILSVAGICLLIGLGAYLAGRRLRKTAATISRLALRDSRISKWTAAFLGIDAVTFLLFGIIFSIDRTLSALQMDFLAVFYLLILLVQLLFLDLMAKAYDYRAQYEYAARLNSTDLDYERAYRENTQSLASLRHDVKNIFLTMSTYVDRSDDQEMKDFYREKIYTFAADTIRKSSIYEKLYDIPSQSLRAFLYLKFSEGASKDIPLRLHINIDKSLPFQPQMDIIDLTRIIGVLIDNAYEEVTGDPDGYVSIALAADRERFSFTIRNSLKQGQEHIRPEDQRAGHSSKEGHSGIGLAGIHRILETYPNAVLNTVENENEYMQSLMIASP